MKEEKAKKIQEVSQILVEHGYYSNYSEIEGFTFKDYGSKCLTRTGRPVVELAFGDKFHTSTTSLRLAEEDLDDLQEDIDRVKEVLAEIREVAPELVE